MRILPDGTFAFPLVGRVQAEGKFPEQVETEISEALKSQYRGEPPQVTVSVRQPSGMQFTVVGKVKAGGTFTPGRYVNLIEALSMAGGASEFANLDNITIIRTTKDGQSVYHARVSGAMKGNIDNNDLKRGAIPMIRSGDTIIVP